MEGIRLTIEIIFLFIAIWIVSRGIKSLNHGEKKLDQVINALAGKG